MAPNNGTQVCAPTEIALPELAYYQIRAAVAELEAAQLKAQQHAMETLRQTLEAARRDFQTKVDSACAALVQPFDGVHYSLDLDAHRLVRQER